MRNKIRSAAWALAVSALLTEGAAAQVGPGGFRYELVKTGLRQAGAVKSVGHKLASFCILVAYA